MADFIEKTAALLKLVMDNPRVTVRRAQTVTGLSRATIYRYINSISTSFPVVIVRGMIVLSTEKKPSEHFPNE